MKSTALRWSERLLPPVLVFVVVILAWHATVVKYEIKRYILPGPLVVWQTALKRFDELGIATLNTAKAAVFGFTISVMLGTVIGIAFSQSKFIRRGFYPYAIFLQTVPIIAIAPLMIMWFGFGFQSVVVVSVMISLFPMITGATEGLMAVDADLHEFFRLHNATFAQEFFKLRLPNAVPFLITGAKTSSGLAVIGTIVGEFFAGVGGHESGLGTLVRAGDKVVDPIMFSAVFASTLLGLVVFGTVSLVGGSILSRWYDGGTT